MRAIAGLRRDRRDRPALGCKKLGCNEAYRFIAGWGRLLMQNGPDVASDVRAEDLDLAMVDLWAFRLPALDVGVILAGRARGVAGYGV